MAKAAPDRVRELIDTLGLVPHPERGHYVETHRSSARVQSTSHGAERAASTAIFFLVTASDKVTYLHRLASDEVFHLYEGGPLEVLRLLPDGSSNVARLGLDLARGERPQLAIERGTWFGTELVPGASHCLIGCTVAPGFEFEDFELADAAELIRRYPDQRERIARMRRPGELAG
jgi:predicted cupin superfamily sugar epimerase